MDAKRQEIRSAAEQAAHWLRVMESGSLRNRKDFWEWLSESPVHVRELLLAVKLDQGLNAIDPRRRIDVADLIAKAKSAATPLPTPAAPERSAPHPLRRATRLAAGFAAIAILASGTAIWLFNRADHYTTRVGEQRVFELSDGSVIYLNTQSRVRVRYSAEGRDVDLQQGQALFQVAQGVSRPFRVHAASVIIQALGTEFDVRLKSGQTTVAVMQGAVRVVSQGASAPSSTAARVDAGKGAAITRQGEIQLTPEIDSEAISAWRRQRLIFRNDDLATIVNEFNRYNAGAQLRVEGKTLRERRFHGTFNAHSPESLLTYLSGDATLEIVRDEKSVVIRERPE